MILKITYVLSRLAINIGDDLGLNYGRGSNDGIEARKILFE